MQEKGYTSTCIIETGYLRLVHMNGGRENTFTKRAISIALLLFSPSSPLEVPQVSLRDPASITSLRSERSVHHSEWILSVLLPEDQGTTAKQNKTEKITHCVDSPPPQPHLYPQPPAFSEAGMLDQFVIQQAPSPSLKAPLNFGCFYPNPVLGLLKVHAAALPSACPHPNLSSFLLTPFPPYIIFIVACRCLDVASDINIMNKSSCIWVDMYKKGWKIFG